MKVKNNFTETSLLHCGGSGDRALGQKIMKKYFLDSPVLTDSKHKTCVGYIK